MAPSGLLADIPGEPMLVVVGAAVLGSIYVVWRLVGVAMKVIFFVASFAVGFLVTYGVSELSGHHQPLWVYGGEALAFAWVLSLIRAKIARAITALAVLGLSQITGLFAHKPPPAAPKPKKHVTTHKAIKKKPAPKEKSGE